MRRKLFASAQLSVMCRLLCSLLVSLVVTCGAVPYPPCTCQYYRQPLENHLLNCQLGEGNGNPLQYSCLENPMNRGAWWAAVYGVAQSQA